MSWGWKITLSYLAFVGLMIFMVMMSMSQKVDLETEDYYKEELEFQNKIDKRNLTNEEGAGTEISFVKEEESILVKFPDKFKSPTGIIEFYRPSDASLDFNLEVRTDTSNMQWISVKELASGLWEVDVNWKSGDKEYYGEERLMIY